MREALTIHGESLYQGDYFTVEAIRAPAGGPGSQATLYQVVSRARGEVMFADNRVYRAEFEAQRLEMERDALLTEFVNTVEREINF